MGAMLENHPSGYCPSNAIRIRHLIDKELGGLHQDVHRHLITAAPMSFEEESDELLRQFIRFQLEELEAIECASKGKGRAGHVEDDAVALRLYGEDLKPAQRSLTDYDIAQSINAGMGSDMSILEAIIREDAMVRRDRELAIALSEGRPLPPEDDWAPNSAPAFTPIGKAGPSSSIAFRGIPRASSSFASTSSRPVSIITVDCVICMNSVGSDKTVKVPCGHYYDFECLVDLFLQATKDESLMPARCCKKAIPVDLARRHLTASQTMAYSAKEFEYKTTNRLYCPRASCSAFLGAADATRGIITCYRCLARVCSECKALEHPLGECRPDTGDETLVELARQEGYQRCPACHRFTELTHGCFHMTCACRAQFCYRCGMTWKNCDCPQWDEGRLLERAQQQVQAQYGLPPPRPVAANLFRARVNQAVNQLRVNHDCNHPRWNYRSGEGQCEECRHYLNRFLLCCVGCRMLACVRCTRNRL